MDFKEHIALEITTALIKADPTILKGTEPQLVDRRIRAAVELLAKVSDAVKQKVDEG